MDRWGQQRAAGEVAQPHLVYTSMGQWVLITMETLAGRPYPRECYSAEELAVLRFLAGICKQAPSFSVLWTEIFINMLLILSSSCEKSTLINGSSLARALVLNFVCALSPGGLEKPEQKNGCAYCFTE